MPQTGQFGLRAINGYTRRMRDFVRKMTETNQVFTVIELTYGAKVPLVCANAFLSSAFKRKELTRKKYKSHRLCYHYSAGEKLHDNIISKGEIANLVWEEMKNQFPERFTVPEVRRNINLRSGGDYNRKSIDRLVRTWFLAGYLERVSDQSRTRVFYKYKIRPEFMNLPQRPIATRPKKVK